MTTWSKFLNIIIKKICDWVMECLRSNEGRREVCAGLCLEGERVGEWERGLHGGVHVSPAAPRQLLMATDLC